MKEVYTGRPLQTISYAEKSKDDFKWANNTADFFINQAVFGKVAHKLKGGDEAKFDMQTYYDVYNNKLPTRLFEYVSNPLAAKEGSKYKGLPARIRMYNIVRPNIDLLIGEWNKRPFQYDVVNVDGDDVINSAMMFKNKAYGDNVGQRFINTLNQLHQKDGNKEGSGVPSEEISNPRVLMSELNVSYKDMKALRGYRALRVLEAELKIREVWRRLFKDWLIAGQCYTFKLPVHDEVQYQRLSPAWVDYDMSNQSPYIEDGSYAVAKFRVTPSEVVDLFYNELKKKDIDAIDSEAGLGLNATLFNSIAYIGEGDGRKQRDKVDLFLVTWKSKKKIGFLTYRDPLTGEEQMDTVDEAYKVDKNAGEEIEWMWVNESWMVWRIDDDKYLSQGPVPCQRNEMNNFSACKLAINGKRFSDTEGEPVSPVSLGMTYQILFIVLMFRLEHTIAKSKGKIALIDKDGIPDEDEEEFFWYGDAMSAYLIDAKKTSGKFNNWGAVYDLSLFEYIKQITEILNFVRGQWDELLGISRQRKGQTTSSDGLGMNQEAIFRSTVISDLIFTGFEEFLESELTGLYDNTKFAWVNGKKGYYRNDDGRLELLELEGEDYANDQCGVFVQNMSSYIEKFNQIKANVNAIAQRKDVKVSTIIDLTVTESLTELKALVKKAEAAEVELAQKIARNEQEAEAAKQKAMEEWEEFKHFLDLDMQEKDHDRLDNREYIKASLDKDPGAGIDPYLATVEQQSTERLKSMEETRRHDKDIQQDNKWIALEDRKLKSQEKIAKEKNATAIKNKTSGEK